MIEKKNNLGPLIEMHQDIRDAIHMCVCVCVCVSEGIQQKEKSNNLGPLTEMHQDI